MSRNWAYSFKNLFTVLFHPNFQTRRGLERQTEFRYGEAPELEFYGNPAHWEYLPQEMEIFNEINQVPGQAVIIIGCGAGREFGQLKDQRLVGIDTCEVLLQKCRELYPQIETQKNLNEVKGRLFDVVYISFHVYNHIQGRAHRLEFLRNALSLLGPAGRLYLHVDEFNLSDGWKFLVAGHILRLRWMFGSLLWQKGDTVRGYNGSHNTKGRIFFYHYFHDANDVKSELDLLEYDYEQREGFWPITKVAPV